MEVAVRRMDRDDLDVVVLTIESMKEVDKAFRVVKREEVEKSLHVSPTYNGGFYTLIASNKNDPGEIYGFMVFQYVDRIALCLILFVFEHCRRQGISKLLLDEANKVLSLDTFPSCYRAILPAPSSLVSRSDSFGGSPADSLPSDSLPESMSSLSGLSGGQQEGGEEERGKVCERVGKMIGLFSSHLIEG